MACVILKCVCAALRRSPRGEEIHSLPLNILEFCKPTNISTMACTMSPMSKLIIRRHIQPGRWAKEIRCHRELALGSDAQRWPVISQTNPQKTPPDSTCRSRSENNHRAPDFWVWLFFKKRPPTEAASISQALAVISRDAHCA